MVGDAVSLNTITQFSPKHSEELLNDFSYYRKGVGKITSSIIIMRLVDLVSFSFSPI
jgi:hypothetical protein